MVRETLLLAAVSTAMVASAYLWVGVRLWRGRRVSDGADRALRFFSVWWIAIALNQIGGAVLYGAAAMGTTSLEWQLTYTLAQRLLLSIALVGLMYYFVYLLTGRSRIPLLVAFYSFFLAYQVYTIMRGRPEGVAVTAWRTDLDYAVASPPVLSLVTFLWLVVPPVLGAAGLFHLHRSVPDRARKARILTVSIGLAVWWTVAVAAGHPRAFDVDGLQVLNRVVGVVVAFAILLAYEPTRWLQRRLRLDAEPTHAP